MGDTIDLTSAGFRDYAGTKIIVHPKLSLVAILLIAAALRIYALGDQCLWLDEFWTAELSTGRGSVHLELPTEVIIDRAPPTTHLTKDAPSPLAVWTHMSSATHPPLYFFILRLWREILPGDSDIGMRMLSVLASLFAILLLYFAGSELLGIGPALWACLIMALASPQIEYAQQVRNYTMLIAFALAAAMVLVSIEKRGVTPVRAAALGVLILATLLTHYFAFGAIAAMLVYSLIRLRGKARLLTAGSIIAAGIIFALIWGPVILSQKPIFSLNDPTTSFLARDSNGHVLATFRDFSQIPFRLLTEPWRWISPYIFVAGVVYVAPIFFLRRSPGLLLPILWLWGTVGFVAAIDLARSTLQLNYIRYTLLAGPALYLILAGMLWNANRWLRHLLPGIAAGICIVGLFQPRENRTIDWPAVVQAFNQIAKPGQTVVFAAPGKPPWTPGYMYMAFSHYSERWSHPIVLLRDKAPDELLKQLPPRGQIILVNGSDVPPLELLPGYDGRGTTMPGYPDGSIWALSPASKKP